jgi:cytosine/adenosine deaminase-related metal-dependent hydrolase
MSKQWMAGCNRILAWIALCVAILPSLARAGIEIDEGTQPGKYVLKGHIVAPDEIAAGKLVIEGEQITCVAAGCEEPAGATVISITNAYIFPGFIDAHNHVAYNVFPKWKPPRLYSNRAQWQSSRAYKEFKAPYNDLKKTVLCEMVKYGEIKALISGVTTIQGTAPDNACFRTLVRNAENQNELGTSSHHIRTFILDIAAFEGTVDWRKTKSFVVHLSEGIDEKSRGEFVILKQKKLLSSGTVVIHGTAFGEPEFRAMGKAGAKLIWSPQSNLVLYGKTTDIGLAREHGVPISLGVDWNATGSDSIFDELRVASSVNREKHHSVIPDSEWLSMITVNPATALALDTHIGRLAPGMKADITIVRSRNRDPSISLLENRLEDVQMVWVGGDLLYADEDALEKLKPGQCEALTVHGSAKRICVKDTIAPAPKSDQTLSEITRTLKARYRGLAPLSP